MWLDLAGRDLSPKTLHECRKIVNRVVLPAIGEVRLDRLDASMLDRLYSRLGESGPKGRPLAPLECSQGPCRGAERVAGVEVAVGAGERGGTGDDASQSAYRGHASRI